MKATLVFKSTESIDLSIGMVFTPCICWVINKQTILNPHPDNPNYLKGDFQKLIQLPIFTELQYSSLAWNKIVIVVHEEGHGTKDDIDNLASDIIAEGFELKIVNP